MISISITKFSHKNLAISIHKHILQICHKQFCETFACTQSKFFQNCNYLRIKDVFSDSKKPIYVSVHVRRTDYESAMQVSILLTFSELTKGANFTKILQAAFSYKNALRSFSLLTLWIW